MRGIDCASKLGAVTARRAKAAGFDFVGRYLVPDTYAKALTRSEAEAICGAGLRILSVYETTANRAAQGWDAGAYDGLAAKRCAEAIGMPKDGIIYFAVDYEPSDADLPKIAQYLAGAFASAGGYEIGVYGCYRVIEAMHEHGVCKGFWQCVAWSYGKLSQHRTVYQSDWSGTAAAKAAAAQIGVGVDLNDCSDMDKAGLWDFTVRKAAPIQNAQPEEVSEALIKRLLQDLTPLQAYEVLKKAQEYAATLPAAEWAQGETREAAEYAAAKETGITDGTRPMAPVTRLEAALMAFRASCREK